MFPFQTPIFNNLSISSNVKHVMNKAAKKANHIKMNESKIITNKNFHIINTIFIR